MDTLITREWPVDCPPSPDRLQRRARQRRRRSSRAPRRLRIHRRVRDRRQGPSAFGFYPRGWTTIDYPTLRGIGRFESKAFEPEEWRPRRPESRLREVASRRHVLGAPQVDGISDDIIRAAVQAGRYSDPARGTVPCRRADRAARQDWPRLADRDQSGRRSCARRGRFAELPECRCRLNFASRRARYSVKWYRFDNVTGESQEIGTRTRPAALRSPRRP